MERGGATHAPADYDCPFCALVRGEDLPAPRTTQPEIVLRKAKTKGRKKKAAPPAPPAAAVAA